MSKPFDSTIKQLVEADPAAWLKYAGLPGDVPELIEADLSTLTVEADKVLRVPEPSPYLAHFEFQAGYDADMGKRLLRYNILLLYRHNLPVQSVLVLLREAADGPAMTGSLQYTGPDGDRYLDFRYRVVRVWEKPVETVLAGDLKTLPLAPLSDVAQDALPDVIRRMELRIKQEASPSEARELWSATYILMGLRYLPDFTAQLLKGVQGMEESATYQVIIAKGEAKGRIEGKAEGKAEEARNLLLKLGNKRFGTPDAQTLAAIDSIESVAQLERLAVRILEVESWQELLA